MQKSLIFIFIFGLIILGLFLMVFPDLINSERIFEINDIRNSKRIVLKPNNNQGGIHSLSLMISGKSDGKIIISKAYSDSSIDFIDTVESRIDLNYSGDWYSDSCILFFENINAKKTKLKICFRFYGMNNL